MSGMDGSDGPVDRLIVTSNHSITVNKSRSSHQQKPLSHTQTTAASTGAVQPTNQDGEIEFVMRCCGQECRLVGMVSNDGHQLKWKQCRSTGDKEEEEWKVFPSPKINVINQLNT